MAAANIRGIMRGGSNATMKHYACNSQEKERSKVNAVVSERALREIYLKAFEIAVREGGANSVMTSYNPVNGHWSASNYDLNTTILRKEWGFEGIVMTRLVVNDERLHPRRSGKQGKYGCHGAFPERSVHGCGQSGCGK